MTVVQVTVEQLGCLTTVQHSLEGSVVRHLSDKWPFGHNGCRTSGHPPNLTFEMLELHVIYIRL